MSRAPDTDRHRRLEAMFLAAVQQPPADRREFVDRACADDAALRADLASLLGYADDPRCFLDPGGDGEAADDSGCPPDRAPTRIGAYRLLRILGQGGMGTVFLAEQDEPVQRQVALKLVRRGMATAHVLARFQVERQALARMNHDFVARVHETGLTEQGEPWFAMEFVDGPPIDVHCDRHHRPVHDRLRLFVQVCEGVQHAHQKGILHRDLKPTNVLVATSGERSVPKVIDFGLARAVDPSLAEWGAATLAGSPMGTPGYMSPEQARGEAVDTRADIFSLGVLLHELLVGSVPRADAPTQRPSTSLHGDAAADAARRRGSTIGALRRQLRGGLDWIVLKATDPDPERRYASVSEFAADIRRHLEHQPVSAGPPSPLYRLQKLLRRHRYALAATAMVTAVGIAGVVAWLSEARAAVRASGLAKAVNDYLLEDLLERAQPEQSLGRKITVEEVFLDAAARIGPRFAGAPDQEAAVRAVIRDTFNKLGLTDAAVEQAQLCYDLRKEHLGARHRDTLTAAARLGDLWIARDDFARGEAMLAAAVRDLRATCGDDDPATLDARLQLAAYWTFGGKAEPGEQEMAAVIAARERTLGPKNPRTLSARAKLSQALGQRQAFAEVVPLEREILAARREVLGDLHPDTLTSMNNLASTLMALDRLDEALSIYAELLPLSLQVRGHTLEHAYILNNYGCSLQRAALAARRAGDAELQAERLDRAEELLLDNLRLRRQCYGERHNKTATAMVNLALVYRDREQFDQAIPLFESALDIGRESLGDNGRNTLTTWLNLAVTLRDAGHRDRSLATFETLFRCGAEGLAGQPVTRGAVHDAYGVLLQQLGRTAEAEAELLAGHRDLLAGLDDQHSRTQGAVAHLIDLYRAMDRADEAARWQAQLDTVRAGR